MARRISSALLLLVTASGFLSCRSGPTVIVTHDDTVITRSCRVRIPGPVLDLDGDGVVHIEGDGLVVQFQDPLTGFVEEQPPSRHAGVGIAVRGKNVRLSGAVVSGFRVGIQAVEADGLVLDGCEVVDNFRQRLGSTHEAEDSTDWLWPHANDGGEWADRYGAGILVRDSDDVTVRDCLARRGQNGLLLERVNGSKIYDNDFSFLSGWGIALWRSSDNVISRNALDFCVRGYSHGKYNRGQDSAGILLFEQCSRNVIVENSATHGGDGFFGFAGKEALGEHPKPYEGFAYARAGNTGNVLARNDFSYAVAHGIEMTFSFGNRFLENRIVGNAICGVWGGYSKDTLIEGNHFEQNGDMAYGLERGGVNIEHGERNRIVGNTFVENACGVHLWWDEDAHLAELPWTAANGAGCGDSWIADNSFVRDEVAVHLRACDGVHVARNRYEGVQEELRLEGPAPAEGDDVATAHASAPAASKLPVFGKKRPVGARSKLAGRHNIVMTEWGPWEHATSRIVFHGKDATGGHLYRILARRGPTTSVSYSSSGGAVLDNLMNLMDAEDYHGAWARIVSKDPEVAGVFPYTLHATVNGEKLTRSGVLISTPWTVTSFPWTSDPREALDAWRDEAASSTTYELPALNLVFASGGPSQLPDIPNEVRDADLPKDRFGTLATTRIPLPAGRWRIATRSDDGIRVTLDGEPLIEDWTWHPPKNHAATFELDQEREVEIRVEHFELDGYAQLEVRLEPE